MAETARRRPYVRHPGMVVHWLSWSMAHGRPVKAILERRRGVHEGRVVRCYVVRNLIRPAERRDPEGQHSHVAAEFEDGMVLPVNDIARVVVPGEED